MNTGAKRRKPPVKKPASGARRPSRKSRASRATRKSRKMALPKTAKIVSRNSLPRDRKSRASSSMSVTELQFMAKSQGIPFGGLSKTKLIKKLNNYY